MAAARRRGDRRSGTDPRWNESRGARRHAAGGRSDRLRACRDLAGQPAPEPPPRLPAAGRCRSPRPQCRSAGGPLADPRWSPAAPPTHARAPGPAIPPHSSWLPSLLAKDVRILVDLRVPVLLWPKPDHAVTQGFHRLGLGRVALLALRIAMDRPIHVDGNAVVAVIKEVRTRVARLDQRLGARGQSQIARLQ